MECKSCSSSVQSLYERMKAEDKEKAKLGKSALKTEKEMTAALLPTAPPPSPDGTGVSLDTYA